MNTENGLQSFEPHEWRDRVGVLAADQFGQWGMQDVIGPRDACWLLRVREVARDHIAFGPASPTDVFLQAVGEAPRRDCTKIGGLPFWPHDRDWPESETGQPLPFLAQFCFRESIDIVGDVPEKLLLLFGDRDDPSNIVGEWQSPTCRTRLIERHEMPCEPSKRCFYGVRWRTDNYPNADYDDSITLVDGTTIDDPWFVCRIVGMQIGRHPCFPAWNGRPRETERVICSLSAFFPLAGLPCQFVNWTRPLTERESEDHAFDLSEIKDGDEFGIVCVVVEVSGELSLLFEKL